MPAGRPRAHKTDGIAKVYNSLNLPGLALFYGLPLEFAKKIRDQEASGKIITEVPEWWPVYQNVLSIGGKGSGKTFSGAYTLARIGIGIPGGLAVVVRKRHEQLRNTFLAEFYNVLDLMTWCEDEKCPKHVKGEKGHGHKDALIVHEGEKDGAVEVKLRTVGKEPFKIIFRIEPDGDDRQVADSFKSYNLNLFLIEEASQLRQVTFDELRSRLRAGNSPIRRGYVLSNPTTKSHWLAKLAAECEQQALAYNPELPDSETNVRPECLVIRSKMEDNKNLPADYVEQMKRQYAKDPVLFDMFINGLDGVDIEGRPVFAGHFVRDRHVDKSIRFAPDKPLIRGWDFGYQNPACVFMQVTDDGCCNVIAELRAQEVYIEEFVDLVKAFTAKHMPLAGTTGREIIDYGDYAGTQVTDKEGTTVQRAAKRGVFIRTRPNTDIERGLDVIRKLMSEGRRLPKVEVNMDSKVVAERPRFKIHPRCEELIDALAYGYHYQLYKHGQLANKPKKDNRYDHIVDALRYAVINEFGLADENGDRPKGQVKAKQRTSFYGE